MSVVTFEEMEAKRQEMIASFKDIAAAMTRCVSIIEDYTRLSPASLPSGASAADIAKAVIGAGEDKKGAHKKREKKLKDPNAPKRPPSAYILFQNEVRDDIRKANPDVPYKDILSRISEQWKSLPEEQKKVFEDAYQDASVAFRSAEDAYKAGLPADGAAPAAELSESDSDSSSEEESTPPPAPKAAPVITPQIISAAVTATEKKEKKRKNKEEPAVATPVVAETEKKKKKKNKE